MSPATANIFGFAGMFCIIFAYGYGTMKAAPNPFIQHGVNLTGALLLTVSLLVNTNPASLTLEFFWGAIAIYGLFRALRERKQAHITKANPIEDRQA
ncbi:permease [Altererythrobacter indicus]|uniref:Permease n=1 Tax=Altericroceibacterium indicum TaxID=374177 RepID=A0A845A3Q5_9SPHN|nr:permease [Altericroceibacterium indicum]MXP24892.1 permease [Altericroceibacterium indicum]